MKEGITMDIEDLRKAFRVALDLSDDFAVDQLTYRQIRNWDSLAHMVLISEIEDRFDVLLDTDDVIDLSSFEKCLSILEKHGIKL
jgi:acyl carrier protein